MTFIMPPAAVTDGAELRAVRQAFRWLRTLAEPKYETHQFGCYTLLIADVEAQPGHLAKWLWAVFVTAQPLQQLECGGLATTNALAFFRAGKAIGEKRRDA